MTGIFSDPDLVLETGICIIALLVIYMDWRYCRIPNFLVLINSFLAIGWQIAMFDGWHPLIKIAVTIIVILLIFYILLKKYPDGIGGGDIKYAFSLSIFFGPFFFVILWLASISGLIHRLFITAKPNEKVKIPFGMHLGISSIIAIIIRLENVFYEYFAFPI